MPYATLKNLGSYSNRQLSNFIFKKGERHHVSAEQAMLLEESGFFSINYDNIPAPEPVAAPETVQSNAPPAKGGVKIRHKQALAAPITEEELAADAAETARRIAQAEAKEAEAEEAVEV